MREFNKWQKVKITTTSKTYVANVCPKCQSKFLVQTNYCSECGKHLRRERK